MIDTELIDRVRRERLSHLKVGGWTWRSFASDICGGVVTHPTIIALHNGEEVSVDTCNLVRGALGMEPLGEVRLVPHGARVVEPSPPRPPSPYSQRWKAAVKRANAAGYTALDVLEMGLNQLEILEGM